MFILKVDPPLPQHLVLSLGRGSVGSKGLINCASSLLPHVFNHYLTPSYEHFLIFHLYITHAVMQSHHDNTKLHSTNYPTVTCCIY